MPRRWPSRFSRPRTRPGRSAGCSSRRSPPSQACDFKNASELVAALKHATSPGGVDHNEQVRREAQVEAWRLSEQQARLQAEETVRLAALEQARREIQEQARREVQALEMLEAEAPVEATGEAAAPHASTRRERRRPARPRPLPFLALAVILLVALASYWLDQRLSTGRPGTAYADRYQRQPASRNKYKTRQHERGFDCGVWYCTGRCQSGLHSHGVAQTFSHSNAHQHSDQETHTYLQLDTPAKPDPQPYQFIYSS